MSFDRWAAAAEMVRTHWRDLERDWQSVAVGAVIVVLVGAFELPIPW
ncbi:hypothetical protein [Natrialba sp. INN-245]|nr:hypothetical protein [Natrialba sp. INN-245]